MKKISCLFALLIFCTISTFAQLQYTAVPRSGEGRFDRSSEATFWANPIFFKPSIFFSSEGAGLRANRKWWRQAAPYHPVPDKQELLNLPLLRWELPLLLVAPVAPKYSQ